MDSKLLLIIIGVGALFAVYRALTTKPSAQPKRVFEKANTTDELLVEARQAASNLRQKYIDNITAIAAREDDPEPQETWRLDPITERQINKISKTFGELGIEIHLKYETLTKGQASDIIGLFENPSDAEEEVLNYFKVDHSQLSQTKAREAIRILFQDEANRIAWDNRPPSKKIKEGLTFMGFKAPKEMTHFEAQKQLDKLAKENMDLYAEWQTFSDTYDDVIDKDTREDYNCKKMTAKQYKTVFDALKQSGVSIDDIDTDAVFTKAFELFPELEK